MLNKIRQLWENTGGMKTYEEIYGMYRGYGKYTGGNMTSSRKWNEIEKEILAVVWGVKQFRSYVFDDPKFSLVSNHKRIQWFFNLKQPNQIVYEKKNQNLNADTLSRIKINKYIWKWDRTNTSKNYAADEDRE